MAAALLFPALAAQAGHYEVTYSGGTVTTTHTGSPPSSSAYFLQTDGTWGNRGQATFMAGYGSSGPQSGSAQCSGAITFTGTWHPDYTGEPAPAQVVVTQTCNAGWSASLTNYTPTASAANGLGTTLVASADHSTGASNGSSYQVIAGGDTVTFTCSPTASLSGTGALNPTKGGTGFAFVYYKAQFAPPNVPTTRCKPSAPSSILLTRLQAASAKNWSPR